MTEESKILLEVHEEEFKSYKDFIDKNNWFDDIQYNPRKGKLDSPKLNTEVSIIDTIIKSTNKFKDDIGDDIDKKPIQKFIKFTSEIINKHVERIAQYKRMYPLQNVQRDPDDDTEDDPEAYSIESEVEFHSDLFALITKTKVALSKLKIDEAELAKKSIDLFFGNAKAPLFMREYLCERFPEIQDKTDNLEIDFYATHINPATSNELLINMKPKDIPKWDQNKHFFEQNLSTIQFWEEERRKIINGINIGGYHLSNWLYWHINIFKMAYGDELDKDIKNPLFRDNEFFFDYMYNKAKDHGRRGVFMYGTRRFAKTAGMTSRLSHTMWTVKNAQGTVQGFSKEPDLKALVTYADVNIQNMFPALKIPANSLTLDDGIVLGLKGKKAQERYDFADLTILNLEGGNTKKGTQKTAGSTPDAFLLDEAGKGACIAPWTAAKPSFSGGKGGKWRLVPLLSGTAGEGDLSVDAETMLKDPETFNILPMDWDFLEEFVDPEHVTWKRNNFGFFVPAQMSLDAQDKIVMPFSEFIGQPKNEELSKLEIHVTDWGANKAFFEDKRKQVSNNLTMLAGETNSFPLDPEDCYITTEVNIFPGLECKKRKRYIEDEGIQGQKYRLSRDGSGQFHAEFTTDPLITDYPFKGGTFDAPVVMMENPLLEPSLPPLGLYTMGFDDVKHDKTDGDSVMSCSVVKRGFEGGEWANRLAAYYDSRPERKKDYYKVLHIIMKIFNARLLHENADNGFIEFLEANYPDDLYIHVSESVGLASLQNLQTNANRQWGWAPTPNNIYHLNQRVVRYTKEEGIVIGDIQGLSGVDRINHPMLLEELYKYKSGKNADRLRSFGLAITLAEYYDKTYQYMKHRKKLPDEYELNKPKPKSQGSKGLTDTRKLTKW